MQWGEGEEGPGLVGWELERGLGASDGSQLGRQTMAPSHCVIIRRTCRDGELRALTLEQLSANSGTVVALRQTLKGYLGDKTTSLSEGNVPEWLMGTPRKRMASAAAVRIRSLSFTFANSSFVFGCGRLRLAKDVSARGGVS